MGMLVNLKCNKCGYETNLGLGGGRTFNRLESVISFFEKEIQTKIRELVDGGVNTWNVYKEIGICEKCGKISIVAVFKATDTAGKMVEYHSRCACGSYSIDLKDFMLVLDGKETIYCPACGDVLEATHTGYWD